MALKLGKDDRRLDLDALSQGRSVECPLRPGVSFRVRMAGDPNPAFVAALRDEALTQRVREGLEGGEWLAEFVRLPEVLATAIVADITGILDAQDNPVEYTPEIGLELLSDPAHLDVRRWAARQAMQYADFYERGVAADEGNSGTGSGGKSAGAKGSRKTGR